ncbi:MAG: M42 family peptidase [Pyrobaculum sp.]
MFELSEAGGSSGLGDEFIEVVASEVDVDEVYIDRWGDVVRHGAWNCRSTSEAHMDEVCLVVDHVEKEGFLRARPVGGEMGQSGTRGGGWVRGGAVPFSAPGLKDLYNNIGAGGRGEVEKIGVAVLDREVARLRAVTGKAIDGGAGTLYALIKKLPTTLYIVASVQVELRRAQIAVVVDTPAVSGVGEGPYVARLGRVSALDGGGGGLFISQLRGHVVNVERLGVPYQFEVLYGGSTDAMAGRGGVSTAALSKYVHSPVGVVRGVENAAWLSAGVVAYTTPREEFLDKRLR